MNFKWYIGALVSMISIFVVQQQESIVHNQEIVLHFTSDVISLEDAQKSITLFTNQLENNGASDIQVTKQSNNSYKLSYHSTHNVDAVKKQLNVVDFNNSQAYQDYSTNLPVEKDVSIFQIDVYEVQQDTNGFAGSDSALFFEIKQDFNRGSQVNHPFLVRIIYSNLDRLSEQIVKNSNDRLGLAIASRSYVIPAVRAGPFLS